MKPDRRHFLRTAAAATLGLSGLRALLARPRPPADDPGFGSLVPDPEGLLDLPRGFSYRVLSHAGDRMHDGFLLPALADGMAAFPGPRGRTVVVRNHEIMNVPAVAGAFGPDNGLLRRVERSRLYDAGFGRTPPLGGTTTFVYDTRTGRLERQFLSLAGTVRNCAGGPTPWGSWLTCEESVQPADDGHERDHGFVFEVPARADGGLEEPVPLVALGRFNHEAAAVHERSGVVYMTEDRGDGLLYRLLPRRPGRLVEGGRLQALVVDGRPACDTRNWSVARDVEPGRPLAVRWTDLDGVTAPADDLRVRGRARGAAIFARGEGMISARDGVYFVCTSGGRRRRGQVWRYRPGAGEARADATASLELFVEPDDPRQLDMGDNLALAPFGDLLCCEDGLGEQFVVGITPRGRLYRLARNARSRSEFTGATFSPDGTTLFVNIQVPGITLAVTGPWKG